MIIHVDQSEVQIANNAVTKPKTFTVGAFDKALIDGFRTAVQEATDARAGVVPLVIDSYGGYVDVLVAMLETMDAADHLQFPRVVVGKAMSCGAMITGLGPKGQRFMSPHSRLMIHDLSSITFGKVDDMKVDVEEIERLSTMLFERLSRNCGHNKHFFKNQMKRRNNADWYLTPQEALDLGLIDAIGTPSIKIKIKAETYISV